MSEEQNWGKYMAFGIEIAVGVALGYLAGKWLDQKYGWSPWGVLVGTMLGMAGGMYPVIKEGLKANKG